MDYLRTDLESEQEEGSTISESGSCVVGDDVLQQRPSFAQEHGLMELLEGDKAYDLIYRNCKSSLVGGNDDQCEVVSILRNGYKSFGSRAKLKSFQIFQEAVEMKHGGVGKAKVKYGWCVVKKTELCSVFDYGFSEMRNDGSFGRGLYLSPDHSLLECLKESALEGEEEDGMRFLVLCRVILGKSEIVHHGSTQSCPSSQEFDSGVDDLVSPKKYIMWSTHMNTHVLPEFLVCIKAPSSFNRNAKRMRSPWMAFPVLIRALSKFLPPSQVHIIQKHYKEQQSRRISRSELIQRVRTITGDKLLVHIIKAFGHKAQH